MTAVSLVFPGSRIVAAWWKRLTAWHPRALWVGHLLLHRVEALVRLQLPARLDSFPLLVLQALALTSGEALEDLDQRLHLGHPLVRQLLRHLETERLVRLEEGRVWSLTPLGRQVLVQGTYPRTSQERRAFYFAESEEPARPPHFLNLLPQPAAVSWPAVEGWQFQPGHLQACLSRPAAWKQRFGFPPEVQQILGSGTPPPRARSGNHATAGVGRDSAFDSAASPPPAWQRVILDRPERLVAVLVLVRADEKGLRLLGFAVQQEGWVLQAAEPAFVVQADWQEPFPELAVDPPLEVWRQAWRVWCQPRGLPPAEAEACVLERQEHRLYVMAPPRLVERLRTARSDVFKGEVWLLAGASRLRAAAQVELSVARSP